MGRPIAVVIGLLIVVACVSRSLPGERFFASLQLTAPELQVTLGDPSAFSFAMVGDLHIQNANTAWLERMLTELDGRGTPFLVLLGDMVDQGSREDFQGLITLLENRGWKDKTLMVVGNHDVFYEGWEHYKTLVGPSHYRVKVGSLNFIAVDTGDGTVGQDQFDWLQGELAKIPGEPTFIISHYLPVIPGIRTYLKLASETESLRLMNLASDSGVMGWLGGHYHSYIHGRVNGVDYVVAGGGGGRRMEPVLENFYVIVNVSGKTASYEMVPLE